MNFIPLLDQHHLVCVDLLRNGTILSGKSSYSFGAAGKVTKLACIMIKLACIMIKRASIMITT